MFTTAPMMVVLHVRDLATARAFYESTLGLRVLYEDPMGLELDAAGTLVRLGHHPEHQPIGGTVAGWTVEDLETTLDAMDAAGVTLARFDGLEQDPRGIWQPFPGGPRIAWFRDPDGNTLSVRQM